MKVAKISDIQYLLRLEGGEEVVSTLTAFCDKHNIKNAWIMGLGSIETPTLAHYRVDTKKYSEKKLEGVYEVTSLQGNVAIFEEQPLLHIHITLGNENMQAFAGHFVSGVVSATLEVEISVWPSGFEKKQDAEIGLKLLDLPNAS